MRETSLRGTTKTAQRTQQSLLRLVREACDLLLSTHPSIVEAVTISYPLGGSYGMRFATRMVARMAREYDLDVDTRINGGVAVVRLSRNASHSRGETNLVEQTTEAGY